MSACNLPDPKEVDYDLLLRYGLSHIEISYTDHRRCSRILAYLDLYGEAESLMALCGADGCISGVGLHCCLLRCGGTPQAGVGLGVEGISESEPEVPEESEAPGKSLSLKKVHCCTYVATGGHSLHFRARLSLLPA